MTRRLGLLDLGVAGLILGAVFPAKAGDPLESVEKELLEKWSRIKSYSAKLTMTAHMDTDAGSNRTRGSGTLEFAKQDGRRRFRMDLTQTMTGDTFTGTDLTTNTSLQEVCDGRYVYVLVEQTAMGMSFRTAVKNKMDAPPTMDAPPIIDPVRLFKTLRANNELKLLEVSVAELPPVYTVEATPKDPYDPVGRLVVHFAKDSGIVLRTKSEGRHSPRTMTATYSDIRIDVGLDPNRFVFTLPRGVGLIDATGG